MILTLLAIYVMGSRGRPHWAVALAAVAPIRFLVATVALLTNALIAILGGSRGTPRFDEYNFAMATGVEPTLVFLGVTAFLLWSWVEVWRSLSRPRWKALAAITLVFDRLRCVVPDSWALCLRTS